MKFRFVASTTLLLLGLAAAASASPVGLVGSGSSGTVDATLVSLTWTADASALPLPGPPWNDNVNSATHLTFAGCTTGNLGDPGCLFLREGIEVNNNQPFCGGINAVCPSVTGLPVTTFLQFESHPNLIFELDGVAAGFAQDCATAGPNDACSIFINGVPSPVRLIPNGAGGSFVGIGLFGTASDAGIAGLTTLGSNSLWQGGFSATIPNLTPHDILLHFCPSGTCTSADVARSTILHVDSVSGSFSATAIPEPGTVSMIVIGVALVTLSRVRRRAPKA